MHPESNKHMLNDEGKSVARDYAMRVKGPLLLRNTSGFLSRLPFSGQYSISESCDDRASSFGGT